MPYRIDLHNAGDDSLDRLVELGALDVENSDQGGIAALMPDRVTLDTGLARARGRPHPGLTCRRA